MFDLSLSQCEKRFLTKRMSPLAETVLAQPLIENGHSVLLLLSIWVTSPADNIYGKYIARILQELIILSQQSEIQFNRVLMLWDALYYKLNTLRPRQNCRHFADDIFKCIFLNENVLISLKVQLKFVPNVRINNNPALIQIMDWHRPGDNPLSESMVVSTEVFNHVNRHDSKAGGL